MTNDTWNLLQSVRLKLAQAMTDQSLSDDAVDALREAKAKVVSVLNSH